MGLLRSTETLESLVAREAREVLGLETICLAPPLGFLLAPGPKYIRSGNSWKSDVRQMLNKASLVVVFLQPDRGLTEALDWELAVCADLHLDSRMILLLPLQREPGAQLARDGLKTCARRLPGLQLLSPPLTDPINDQAIIVVPNTKAPKIWRRAQYVGESADLMAYEPSLRSALQSLKTA